MPIRAATSTLWLALHALAGGCGPNARVEIAAADSVDVLSASLNQALGEYHADLVRLDTERRIALVQAFIERVRKDIADEAAIETHAAALHRALQRLDADRQTADERYAASLDNVATLQEIAAGLRRMALESMSLDDDVRRYFGEALNRRHKAKHATKGE